MGRTIIREQASIELDIIDGAVYLRQQNPAEDDDVVVIAGSNLGRLISELEKAQAEIEKDA